ncbi:MAG: hypothetical protein JMDDDDMK_01584 [Acidobacteria bacterium]|nr:hypothetical protein [Acidobacteriota bacterium]
MGVALDPAGNPFVTGVTGSADFFPLINATQTKLNLTGGTGGTDAFVIGFDAVGGKATWATYLGGGGIDRANGIAIDQRGNVYVAGGTASTNYPAVNATPQPLRSADALLVKFSPNADLALAMTDLPDPVMVNQNLTYTATVTNGGTDAALGVTMTDTLPPGVNPVSVTSSQGTCSGGATVTCDLGNLPINASATVAIVVTPTAAGSIKNRASVISVTSDPNTANNSAEQDTVVGDGSSIFGRVAAGDGSAVGGVTVALSGASSATATTRGDGGYQFANLTLGGAYTVTPSLPGYVFTPASQSVNNLASDRQLNFTATGCAFGLAPFKQSFPATGGPGSMTVTCNDQRCPWTARSNAPWITITSAGSGAGNGAVTFSVAPTVGSRSGTLTAAGATFTVLQEFNPCAGAEFRTISMTPLPQGEASARFALGDFNSDGRPDLAFLIANPDQAPRVTVAMANNNGGFGAPLNIFTGSSNGAVRTIHSGDLNGDGRADLVLTGSDPDGNNGRMTVLLSSASGGFSPPDTFSVGPSPTWAVIGDFNNDGKIDLAVATGSPNGNPGPVPQNQNVAVLPGDGAGRFGAAINSSVSISAQGLARMGAGDFNNDGKLDVALLGFVGSLITMKGDGAGKFTELSTFNFFTGSIRGMALGDFNNDRRADVMLSNGNALFADTNGNLTAPRNIAGASGVSVVAEDFNGDGKTDAAFADAGATTMLFSRGGGEFDPPVSYLNGMAGVSGFAPFAEAEAGDYNRDGRPDLFVIGNPPNASQNMFSLTVMVANLNGEFDAPRNFPFGVKFPGEDMLSFSTFGAKTADFNGDGVTDLAVAYSQDKVSILFGNGRGGFGAPVGYRTADLSNIIAVRDFTRDGKPDLATLSPYLGRVTLLINDGAGRFLQTKSFATGGSPLAMTVEDFNGDGAADIVVKGSSGGLSLFAGDGAGNFTERTSGLASEFASARFTAGDFDGDGAADLVVVSASDQGCFVRVKKLLLLFGDGKGGFGRTRTINTTLLPGAMFAGDLNGDGRDDLVFASSCSTGAGLYVMLGAKDGLDAPSLQNANAGPVALGDFNGDGRLDVAAGQGTNLAILTGKGDGALNPASIATLSSFTTSFAFGDFNEDGATDAAAVSGQAAIMLSRSSCAPASSLTTISAASFTGFKLAAESIAAGFGANLAAETAVATTIPLPTTLAGVSVKVKDAAGVERNAPLFFVSPGQINYLVPPGAAPGNALVTVFRNGASTAAGTIQITSVNPGLFAADSSGLGLAAALALRVKPDGSQSFEPVVRYDAQINKLVAVPIDMSNPGEQVFLIIYGTGLRNHGPLSNVSAQIGGAPAEVLFAGAQGGFVGLDQVNLRLPRSLAGRGEVDVVLTVDGKTANTVKINVK